MHPFLHCANGREREREVRADAKEKERGSDFANLHIPGCEFATPIAIFAISLRPLSRLFTEEVPLVVQPHTYGTYLRV